MRSRITIDLDEANQPVIKIQYVESDDLRDKIVKRFLEKLGHESRWCEINFEPSTEITTAIVSAIHPSDLATHQDLIWRADQRQRGWTDEVSQPSPKKDTEVLLETIIEKLRDAGMQDAVDVIWPEIVSDPQTNNYTL